MRPFAKRALPAVQIACFSWAILWLSIGAYIFILTGTYGGEGRIVVTFFVYGLAGAIPALIVFAARRQNAREDAVRGFDVGPAGRDKRAKSGE